MEYWSIGVSECWSTGGLEYWSVRVEALTRFESLAGGRSSGVAEFLIISDAGKNPEASLASGIRN
jgi:hypothetical protein